MHCRHWGDVHGLVDLDTPRNINLFDAQPIESIFTGYDTNISIVLHSPNEIPVIWNKMFPINFEDILKIDVFGTHIIVDTNFKM